MNKYVLVTVSGLHTSTAGEDDRIETKIPGTYILRNGVHYIKYTEYAMTEDGKKAEGPDSMTDVLMKISPGMLEMTRSGMTKTHMVFSDSNDSSAEYGTPFGMMKLDVYAVTVSTRIEEHRIRVKAGYTLEADGVKLSDAIIDILIEEDSARTLEEGNN